MKTRACVTKAPFPGSLQLPLFKLYRRGATLEQLQRAALLCECVCLRDWYTSTVQILIRANLGRAGIQEGIPAPPPGAPRHRQRGETAVSPRLQSAMAACTRTLSRALLPPAMAPWVRPGLIRGGPALGMGPNTPKRGLKAPGRPLCAARAGAAAAAAGGSAARGAPNICVLGAGAQDTARPAPPSGQACFNHGLYTRVVGWKLHGAEASACSPACPPAAPPLPASHAPGRRRIPHHPPSTPPASPPLALLLCRRGGDDGGCAAAGAAARGAGGRGGGEGAQSSLVV